MDINGFTRFRPRSRQTVESCSCSLCAIRLTVTCFLFICIVLLLQLYEHKRDSSLFHRRSIRQYLRIDVNVSASVKKLVLLSDEIHSNVKDLKLQLKDKKARLSLINFDKRNHQVNDRRNHQVNVQKQDGAPPPPQINATHIDGILMEPVNAEYTRNIYFTVKTTYKYYTKRLFPLMLTWLQVVDKNKVSIISDRFPSAQVYVDTMRRAGFDIIDTNCSSGYSQTELSCKQGTEFGAYYKAIEKHPGEEDNYQWYCHVDDDMYVNVPRLSQFLQQYDPHKPYYLGKWPRMQRGGKDDIKLSEQTAYYMSHEANHTLKQMSFRYATGAAYCISYAIMMEAKKFLNGPAAYNKTYTLAHLPDDITVGLTIGILLGYNLTDINDMKNHYDSLYSSSLEDLTKYLTVSYSLLFVQSLEQFASSLNIPKQKDPTRVFLLYHCLLYPTVSWCQQTHNMR